MQIIKLREHKEKLEQAATWFHQKWEIPLSAYQESMEACLQGAETIPQWYMVIHESEIIGGLGIIENDFHNRKSRDCGKVTPRSLRWYEDARDL